MSKRSAEESRKAVGSADTGLTPRVTAALSLTGTRSTTPRLAATASPRQSAAAGRGPGTDDDEVDAPPLLELDGARTPPVQLSYMPAAETEWHSVPKRRSSRRTRGEAPLAINVACALQAADELNNDEDDYGVIYAAHAKQGRNPRGKHSQTYTAALKRNYAIEKRNVQRGGTKR